MIPEETTELTPELSEILIHAAVKIGATEMKYPASLTLAEKGFAEALAKIEARRI